MSRAKSLLVPAGLLAVHAGLVAWVSCHMSPTLDEVGHLAGGVYSWQFGRFDVYRVNSPLVRSVAAVPVVMSRPELRWEFYRAGPSARPEWALGREFVEANDRGDGGWFWYFVMARWACLPLSLVGGYVCWRWAGELYGREAGLVALALWCFSPNVTAWAATICPDAGAAALGVAAAYVYWRWLRSPTWSGAAAAGLLLGLALLTKTTWIVLFGLWPALWIVWRASSRGGKGIGPCFRSEADQPNEITSRIMDQSPGARRPPARQLAVIFLLALYVLNLGYAFEGSFTPLGKYTFVSRSLAGQESVPEGGKGGNRFAGTWMAAVPVPVPENFLRGIDLQKVDFEEGKDSYLFGQWKRGGWWYYYLVVAALKVPLGTWMLGGMALGLTAVGWRRGGASGAGSLAVMDRPAAQAEEGSCCAPGGYFAGWRNELALLLSAVVVFALVSSQTGFSRYFRYVLPCLPFAFIWISKVARSLPRQWLAQGGVAVVSGEDLSAEGATEGDRSMFSGDVLSAKGAIEAKNGPVAAWRAWLVPGLAGAALLWSVASSLSVYPHSMSYFNELAGGPEGGHRYVIDANIDWGQDLWYLKRWLDAHPEARPLGMACLTFIYPKHYGIEYTAPPQGPAPGVKYSREAGKSPTVGPLPGWYALSLHRIHSNNDRYLYFLRFKPVAMAGYSIYIYHITLEDANRVRREVGLPQLVADEAAHEPAKREGA
ncbi:MAG: glycosyltransferase family 39 protein [Thermoguttaceae bacterium]|nr:glycosyltransferase family 39 protein [Thermoguttaceae bacterium]